MKKMLDELKKLDVDYEVPEGFSKRVMEKIKNENLNQKEKVTVKVSYLKKYVIPWVSAAAVLLIVALVTVNGTVRDKSSSESAANFSGATDSVCSSAQSVNDNLLGVVPEVTTNNSYENKLNVFDYMFDEMKESADLVDSAMEESEMESLNSPLNNEDKTQNARVEDDLTLESVAEILKRNSIEYEIKDELLILTNEKIEFIKEILSKINDKIEITEEENIIKINLK